MKTFMRGVLLLGFAATVSAQLPAAWQNWRFSAPIDVAAVPAALVGVVVPDTVTGLARRDWIDLRVINTRDEEVPFVLHARLGGRNLDHRAVTLLEPSAVEGKYQQAIVDAGEGGEVHNSVKLRIETTQNLLAWVEIAVSSDLKEWRVVKDRAPIYVLRIEGMGENTDVSYPDSASRYLRIRILEPSTKFRLLNAELGKETVTVAERVPAGVRLTASTDRSGRSVWTSEGDVSAVPMSAVEFHTAQPSFFRAATVDRSDNGDQWEYVSSGDILRAADGSRERAWLTVSFGETHAQRWRITVNNRSDAPVPDLEPVLLTTPRRIVFKPEPGETYRLLYGNPRAPAPSYDLAQVTDVKMLDAAAPAALGAGVENTTWVDPSPWTERYDMVLWVALGLAVAILGVVSIRTLRSAKA